MSSTTINDSSVVDGPAGARHAAIRVASTSSRGVTSAALSSPATIIPSNVATAVRLGGGASAEAAASTRTIGDGTASGAIDSDLGGGDPPHASTKSTRSRTDPA